jgi:hypothetical protein
MQRKRRIERIIMPFFFLQSLCALRGESRIFPLDKVAARAYTPALFEE